MGNESENVLVGVATLAIRQPNDALAEWSSVNPYTGSYAAKLSKAGSGNAGSTHLEIIPTGITLGSFNTGVGGAGSFNFYYCHGIAGVIGNFTQIEFRFEDPNSDGHIEITAVPFQNQESDGIWTAYDLATDPAVGYYGANEVGTRMDDWSLSPAKVSTIRGIIGQLTVGGAEESADDWVCTRVRFELWEPTPARFARIDAVRLQGTLYAIEPGGDAPGMSLSSPYTDVGYTEDGVTINYTVDVTNINVEEETLPIAARIASGGEGVEVVCNMAEGSLFNIDKAIAGSVLSGNILTIGAGVLKEMSIKLKGITPGGFIRTYEFPKVVAVGAVGMSFRRAGKTIVPVTFRALKPSNGPAGTYVDNAA